MVVARKPNPVDVVKVTMPGLTDSSEQWQKDLALNGWAVVKGVISQEKAAEYASRANDWLEGFNLGYDRNDRSTWRKENLPRSDRGGLFSGFSFAHSQFVWDVKAEPKIIDLFAKIWGTDKLTVSFDGGNLSVPLPAEEIGDAAKPWPHTDQSPTKPGLTCVQGLINLLPNGPEDGGLAVISGSTGKFTNVWEAFEKDKPAEGWTRTDNIPFKDEWVKWLQSQGCEIVKPCLDPGDFILWDSRCVHWGQSPLGDNPRFAVYICYKPYDWMSEEAKKSKIECFEKGFCTTHDPCTFIPKTVSYADWNRTFPYGRPVLTEQMKKIIGLVPY